MSRNASSLALSAADHVQRLADAALALAHEYAREHGLPVACVMAGLTVARGRMTGGVARRQPTKLDGAVGLVTQHVGEIARREFWQGISPTVH